MPTRRRILHDSLKNPVETRPAKEINRCRPPFRRGEMGRGEEKMGRRVGNGTRRGENGTQGRKWDASRKKWDGRVGNGTPSPWGRIPNLPGKPPHPDLLPGGEDRGNIERTSPRGEDTSRWFAPRSDLERGLPLCRGRKEFRNFAVTLVEGRTQSASLSHIDLCRQCGLISAFRVGESLWLMAPQPFFRSTNCLGVRWRFQVLRQAAETAQRTRSGEKPCFELPLRQHDTYRQRGHGAGTLQQLRSKLRRTIIVTVDKDQNGSIGLCAPHGGLDLTFKLASQQKLVSVDPEDADGGR